MRTVGNPGNQGSSDQDYRLHDLTKENRLANFGMGRTFCRTSRRKNVGARSPFRVSLTGSDEHTLVDGAEALYHDDNQSV